MARDRSLRLTFTAISSGTNINAVRTGLGTSTAVIAQGTTASNYFFGYSDPENLNGFASIVGDAAGFAAQANASADATAAPLISSTSDAAYYIRAAVGQTGFCGPRPQMFTLQSATSTTSSAPSQTSDEWASSGSNIYFPPTCTLVTATTNASGAITSTNVPVGSVIRVKTAGGSLSANVHYLVGSGGKLQTMAGAAVTTTSGSPVVYVNTPSNPGAITVTGYTPATGEMASTAAVEIGDLFMFTSVTGTTWAVNTLYFVNGRTANGFTLASTAGGATITTGTITASSTGFVYRTQQAPVFEIADGSSVTTLTSRNVAGGSAIYHGLSVGDVLVLNSGTISSPAGISAGDALVVKEIVSATEFKVSATYGGDVVSVTSSSSAQFYPVRGIRILPVQIDKTVRQWIRFAQQNFNTSTPADAQTGNTVILYADVCPGRDGSYTLR
jgi:hypothetical protein